jgi:hypothetical protein
VADLDPAVPAPDGAHAGRSPVGGETAAMRRRATLEQARAEGLVGGGKDARIGGRVRRRLIDAAKANAGISSDSELVGYALARLALEEDFGAKLAALKGSLPPDFNLGF